MWIVQNVVKIIKIIKHNVKEILIKKMKNHIHYLTLKFKLGGKKNKKMRNGK